MKLSLYFLAVCWLLIGTNEIFACTCMHLGNSVKPDQQLINQKREGADAVFSGKVIKIERPAASKRTPPASIKVYFKVIKSWKGVTTDNVIVSTSQASSLCGFPFEVKEQYLIYAYGPEKQLSTSICTRTNFLEDATDDINFLGEAEKTFPEAAFGDAFSRLRGPGAWHGKR